MKQDLSDGEDGRNVGETCYREYLVTCDLDIAQWEIASVVKTVFGFQESPDFYFSNLRLRSIFPNGHPDDFVEKDTGIRPSFCSLPVAVCCLCLWEEKGVDVNTGCLDILGAQLYGLLN